MPQPVITVLVALCSLLLWRVVRLIHSRNQCDALFCKNERLSGVDGLCDKCATDKQKYNQFAYERGLKQAAIWLQHELDGTNARRIKMGRGIFGFIFVGIPTMLVVTAVILWAWRTVFGA
jgi:hypothetical protein